MLALSGSSSVADTTALAPCADLTAATFDGSAAYLAVGGAQVQIYNIVKGKFPELAQLSDTQKVGMACLIFHQVNDASYQHAVCCMLRHMSLCSTIFNFSVPCLTC